MSTCKFCHATIKWSNTTDGRSIPIYPEPREDGGLMFEQRSHPNGGAIDVLARYDGGSSPRYRSHLLDCKPLARSLHKPVINISDKRAELLSDCTHEGCTITRKHLHCF